MRLPGARGPLVSLSLPRLLRNPPPPTLLRRPYAMSDMSLPTPYRPKPSLCDLPYRHADTCLFYARLCLREPGGRTHDLALSVDTIRPFAPNTIAISEANNAAVDAMMHMRCLGC